MMSLERN